MINVLFSMAAPALEDASTFRAFGQWVLLHERAGRILFDGVCEPEVVAQVEGALTAMGKAPKIIGAWQQDGTPIAAYPLDTAEWLVVAPDTLDENLTPTRPTTFREVHRWAGWGVKG